MQLHQLQPVRKHSSKKRIGRGGKRGKTSGRGHKGQKARAGNSMRPEMRDLIKKLPKLRGHGKNRARTVHAERMVPVVINVRDLSEVFEDGDTVSPGTLIEKGLVVTRGGKVPQIKLLGNGECTKKVSVHGIKLSQSAREKIEHHGGTIA